MWKIIYRQMRAFPLHGRFIHSRQGGCTGAALSTMHRDGLRVDSVHFCQKYVVNHVDTPTPLLVHCKVSGLLLFLLVSGGTNGRKELVVNQGFMRRAKDQSCRTTHIFITLLSLDGVWDWTDTNSLFHPLPSAFGYVSWIRNICFHQELFVFCYQVLKKLP